jgi:hypothetical protein
MLRFSFMVQRALDMIAPTIKELQLLPVGVSFGVHMRDFGHDLLAGHFLQRQRHANDGFIVVAMIFDPVVDLPRNVSDLAMILVRVEVLAS